MADVLMEISSSEESVNGSGDQPQPITSQTTALEAVEGTSDMQPSTPGGSDDQQIVGIHDLAAYLANMGGDDSLHGVIVVKVGKNNGDINMGTSGGLEQKRKLPVRKMKGKKKFGEEMKWSNIFGELEQKKQLLVRKMKEEMKNVGKEMKKEDVFVNHETQQTFIELCVEVRKCNNSGVTTQVAEYFPAEVQMFNYQLTSSSAYALSHVMREVTKKVERLDLNACNMDDRTFMYIADGIKSMKTSIGELDIEVNKLTDVKQICGLLNKVEDKVYMSKCFADGEGGWRNANRDEKAKLQEALNAIPNTRLKILVKGIENEVYDYIYKQH